MHTKSSVLLQCIINIRVIEVIYAKIDRQEGESTLKTSNLVSTGLSLLGQD